MHQLGPLGVEGRSRLHDRYQDDGALGRVRRWADVVSLPYDSREQVTSGRVDRGGGAPGSGGRHPFPHAIELLTDEPGMLVPQRDS